VTQSLFNKGKKEKREEKIYQSLPTKRNPEKKLSQ
jgi:hypothetical protein